MNYQLIYNQLIWSRKSQQKSPDIKMEKHHIIPKSLGGSNSSENLIYLTLREHYLAHLLLYKMNRWDTERAGKMAAALRRMAQSKRFYASNSRKYEMARKAWLENHPCKHDIVKEKIISSLRQHRLDKGWYIVWCACGCGEEVAVSQQPDTIKYIYEHYQYIKKQHMLNLKKTATSNCSPTKRFNVGKTKATGAVVCVCGCGQIVPIESKSRRRIDGHYPKVKCACGCGKDTSKPNIVGRFYSPQYCKEHKPISETISKNLSNTLSKLSTECMTKRLSNSLWKCDQTQRAKSIQIGKASQYLIQFIDGSQKEFWSYENVLDITGYTYSHIKYRITYWGGIMDKGETITVLQKYMGNSK